jgi:ribose transport system ATP-binding protein
MNSVTKFFPGVVALNRVNFSLERDEIHALIGANGAGKSTLIKILAGVYSPDEGTVEINNHPIFFKNPLDAQKAGIAVIYQEFMLFPNLDIARNIFFGRESCKGLRSIIDWNTVYRNAENLMKQFDFELDICTKVQDLSIAQKQLVEIAKALSINAKILIMDEPTATLTHSEVKRLFTIIERLRKNGVSIIYISHRLDEVNQICNRLTILRNGEVIYTGLKGELGHINIIQKMVGNIEHNFINNNFIKTKELLNVRNLTNDYVTNISFSLNEGEILGIAGLVGSGRTELIASLFGTSNTTSGEIILRGVRIIIKTPKDAIKNGIGMLPESRKEQGLFMNMNIRRNIVIANLVNTLKLGLLSKNKQQIAVDKQIKALKIKPNNMEFGVKNLSGGNQQKVVLAKWIYKNCDILILDEPTRGVDIGAKEEIFFLVKQLVENGKSIIFISSELEEVLRISNRIITLYKGKMTAVLDRENTDINQIMYFITGGINEDKHEKYV